MSYYRIDYADDLTIHVTKANIIYGPGWTLTPTQRGSYDGWHWHDTDRAFEASDQMREAEPLIAYSALIEAGLDPTKLPLTEADGDAWAQPPAHKGYAKGATVIHGGDTFTSRVDNNVWEPGTEHGHTWLRNAPEPDQPGGAAPWAKGVAYSVGQEVTHAGRTWRCKLAHTSHSGWAPSEFAHAVWEPVP